MIAACRSIVASKSFALVIPIVFEPLPEDDPKVRRPDITRARDLLGWQPRISLDDGIERTIEYFKKFYPGAAQLG